MDKIKIKRYLQGVKNWISDTLLVIAEIVGGLIMCLIFTVLSCLGIFYTFGKHIYQKNYSAKKQFKPIMRSFTLVNDCFANAASGELLNDVLKVKDGEIPYGSSQQTISSVTGLRFIYNARDSKFRRILNKLDKDHCELAPSEMEIFYYKHKYSETQT